MRQPLDRLAICPCTPLQRQQSDDFEPRAMVAGLRAGICAQNSIGKTEVGFASGRKPKLNRPESFAVLFCSR